MKRFGYAAITVALLVASGARATSFTYQATFDNGTGNKTITGTFDGTLNGNLITGLSDITAVANGVALTGSGSLYGSHFNSSLGWTSGGAVASLDGTQNNFLFIDVDYPNNYAYTNYYYSRTAIKTSYGDYAFASSTGFSNSSGSRFTAAVVWAATVPAASAVPEPASWAMMVVGFGALGATLRRRRPVVRFA